MTKGKMMPYDDTINEVMDQYDLTSAQRAAVMTQVNTSPCPWYQRIVYMRTHAIAAQFERNMEMSNG